MGRQILLTFGTDFKAPNTAEEEEQTYMNHDADSSSAEVKNVCNFTSKRVVVRHMGNFITNKFAQRVSDHLCSIILGPVASLVTTLSVLVHNSFLFGEYEENREKPQREEAIPHASFVNGNCGVGLPTAASRRSLTLL
jgi:hypothetical protein